MKGVKKNALFNFNGALDFPIVLENNWVRKNIVKLKEKIISEIWIRTGKLNPQAVFDKRLSTEDRGQIEINVCQTCADPLSCESSSHVAIYCRIRTLERLL